MDDEHASNILSIFLLDAIQCSARLFHFSPPLFFVHSLFRLCCTQLPPFIRSTLCMRWDFFCTPLFSLQFNRSYSSNHITRTLLFLPTLCILQLIRDTCWYNAIMQLINVSRCSFCLWLTAYTVFVLTYTQMFILHSITANFHQ